jgi:ATP-dependent protease ClpP protease subunit
MTPRNSKNDNDEELVEEEETGSIRVLKNRIYFYTNVTVDSVLKLCIEISRLEMSLLTMQNEYNLEETPKIYLYIRSDGGDAYAGLSAMDTINRSKVPIITIVDGFVASAATFILMSGQERWMRKSSHILIHQVRCETWMSKYSELKEELTNTKKLMKLVTNIYKEHSNIPNKVLKNIINREMYLEPNTCLKYNLVDLIY